MHMNSAHAHQGSDALTLTPREEEIAQKIRRLKDQAGSHSPSMLTLTQKIPDLKIKVDACFLSNPYATELFLRYLKRELIDTNQIRDVLEFYPSQNSVIAGVLAEHLRLDPEEIFIGNGAIEIIQAALHDFPGCRVVVNIPTFSSYYEFARPDQQVLFHRLRKDRDYALDIDAYLSFVREQKADVAVIINPNNPNGGYIRTEDMERLVAGLPGVLILIDESFIHFAYETDEYRLQSMADFVDRYGNVVIIKSMSKDFGIAGIRAGYAVMKPKNVGHLLKNGFLWNSNGLAEYFFRLYVRKDFLAEYEEVRVRYIKETQNFLADLGAIPGGKVYPSMANFALFELLNGWKSTDFVTTMLIRYGIYVRTCSDKIGLDGEFVRIASRTKDENDYILRCMRELFGSSPR